MVGQDQEPKNAAGAPESTGASPTSAEPTDDVAAAEAPDDADDVRRKFRESLQRKRHQQGEHRSAEGGKSASKVQDGFGPERGRRTFRRKSGS